MEDDFDYDCECDVDDFSDSDYDAAFDDITTGYPVSAQCAAHVHGCDSGPDWMVTYHGCNTEMVCSIHAYQFIGKVMEILAAHGSVVCDECRQPFRYITDFITWRPV
jgi:hypothetical protein